jgi:hypothetical protein
MDSGLAAARQSGMTAVDYMIANSTLRRSVTSIAPG